MEYRSPSEDATLPGSYSFDGDVLCLKFVGETPLSEVEAVLEAALEDSACPARPNLMGDLRASTSIATRTSDEMRTSVLIFADRRERFGKYAVVTTPGARFGMMRMTSVFAEAYGMETGVFTDEASALQWLDAPEED